MNSQGTESAPENYLEFDPGPSLSAFVECFWSSSTPPGGATQKGHRVLPDGCMDIIFDFGATGGPNVSIVGTMSQAQLVEGRGAVDMLGVRFRPGALPSLCKGLDAAELVDRHAELSLFWDEGSERLLERLAEARARGRLSLLAACLRGRAAESPKPDPYVAHCAKRLEKEAGNLSLSTLEKETGLSSRQLERKFARLLGLSPKTIARILRFRRLARALEETGTPGWADLAARFGYSDQAHLSREFKAFSGLSPSDYRARESA